MPGKRVMIGLTLAAPHESNRLELRGDAMAALSAGKELVKLSGDAKGDFEIRIKLVRLRTKRAL